ncbi:MAG: branched-chain amino acid ABC transporter permease [Alphaproteobacteria bacterium]|nr:branched-chain amino acid ABC transporter permease [Alphaproteobacteria bacterium]
MNLLPFVAAGIGLGSVYALAGVGLVVLYRSSGTLNFAFGALGAIGAYCTWSILQVGIPPAIAWAAGIAVATALSFAYGWLIAPLLRHRDRAVRAIGTLGFALFILGCTGLIWGEAVPRRLTLPTDKMYAMIFSVRVTYTRLLALLLALGMVGAIALLLARTRLGLSMRALAADRNISSLIGIRVVRVDAIAWLVSGVFAGVAGLLLADLVALNATFLTFLVIPAIAAAIFGRLQSLAATALGGLVAGITEAVLIAVPVGSFYRSAAPFVLALLFITLFGGRRTAVLHE